MIWPSSLASTVLFRALHEPQDRSPANGWTITRVGFLLILFNIRSCPYADCRLLVQYRFFAFVTAGSFVWFALSLLKLSVFIVLIPPPRVMQVLVPRLFIHFLVNLCVHHLDRSEQSEG
jgi:hypothetical protein